MALQHSQGRQAGCLGVDQVADGYHWQLLMQVNSVQQMCTDKKSGSAPF